MKVEKLVGETVVNIVGMSEKEHLMLKVVLNISRLKVNEMVKENEHLWENHMDLEEAQELANKVGSIIYGLTVEGDYRLSTGSANNGK